MYTGNPDVPDDVFDDFMKSLRSFLETRVRPREEEIMETGAVPGDLRAAAAELGLFGFSLPQEWGGLGLDMTQEVELAMELGYTSLAFRSMLGTNNGIAGQVVANFGTDKQREAWLPRIASGETIASFALTEPGAGSNPASLRTTAVRDGNEWVLNGSKIYITNAPDAGVFMVFARTADASEQASSIGVFLVPADAGGLEVGPVDRKMGQEGSTTAEVTFTDVRVGDEALVGGDPTQGYRAAMSSLGRGRITIAAVAVGLARRALDESVGYAATATQGGVRVGDFQLVQAMLAELQTGHLAGRALVREVARAYDTGQDRQALPSTAKLFCTEMAGRSADLAVQVFGGAGYIRGTVPERLYRDARLLRLYEGTSQIQQLIIGGALVKAAKRRTA